MVGQSAPCDAVNETTEDMPFVTSMVISRDGLDLATVSDHFPISQLAPGFTVTGHLTSEAGERGSLQLTFALPTQADAGTYRCDVTTLSGQGHTVMFRQSVEGMKEEVSINDLVKKLITIEMEKEAMQSKIQDLEISENKSKEEMHIKLTELKAENAVQNNTLKEMKISEQQLKLKINGLEANNSALRTSLESLRAVARVEPDVFFTAILTSTKSIRKDQVVVYDRVVTNEGGAYNNVTRKFTSPKNGYYHFEIHAFASNGNYHHIGLRHNGNIVVTATKNTDNGSGGSNSATLKLAQNDVIDVAGTCCTINNLYYSSPNYISNSFSGRLIALV